MTLEIERVFLLSGMPTGMPPGETWRIEQGYLPTDSTQSLAEGRVRKTTQPDGSIHYTHTVKQGTGRVRVEVEHSISRQEFEAAWPRTERCRISKERTRVRHGENLWEVDRFLDLPIVMAECELDYEGEELEIPAWLAPFIVREVTEAPEYRNYQLARRAGMVGPA